MRKPLSQSGIGHVVVLLVVVGAFAAIGYIGYTLYAKPLDSSSKNKAADSSAITPSAATAPEIQATSDLDKASATLDAVDPSSSNQVDESALDTQLNAF
jgi:hypothetical protein